MDEHQQDYMARALALARRALGRVSPNPAVGAVVVRDGRVVGQGFTQPPGGPHAEIVALREAGQAARGAVLYCTLEPCCHTGRTGPCTEAIIRAGVAEVRYAVDDPDPRVAGGGRAALEAAGVRVVAGEGREEAERLYEAYAKHRRTGLPFVIAKFAASLDGKIAAAGGGSRWITGPESRAWAHRQRAAVDAILAGVETVLKDDPELTARPDGRPAERQPLRVVADSRGRTPPSARLLSAPGPVLVATTAASPAAWRAGLAARGAEVLVLPDRDGRVDLRSLLAVLGERGVLSLLAEGGGVLLGGLFDARLVDKVWAFVAPVVIGAAEAPSPVAGRGARTMAEAVRLERTEVARLGPDLLVTGYPVYPEGADITERKEDAEGDVHRHH
ncbi:MAG TPA: bifunctional diaminohydroxyphosphoribosylaminopyrimidine deaminase/5-amino-6-(5-phosphoribosylamino)uracil reductase RibD [Dehalococcoidia bacterium]